MTKQRRLVSALAAAGALALGLAACSSEGGRQEEGEAVQDETFTVAMITHGVEGDTFFDIVRAGAEAAAAKDNVELQYYADDTAQGQATLVQNAIDQDVDGIAVTLARPDEMAASVAAANEAGIPIVAFNAGIEQWVDVGAMSYFGTDEHLAGTAFGERLTEEGAQHAICVVMEQGHVALETRCASLTDAFAGQTDTIYVDGSDMTDVKSTITSTLQSDPTIDYVVTLGAPFAMTALDSVEEAGSEASVATFDMNADAAQAIQDGRIKWSVDQQPYLQGYESVDALWLYLTNGNTMGGGTEPVLTGPSFVDESNIDTVIEYAQNGTR
ncbi:MAG TPA: substrate-binding domain-containing protein [Glycomyces sp.]|nr:substrate-binding domain-containing protein [Glycomyces sp.]